jgi:protein TonB
MVGLGNAIMMGRRERDSQRAFAYALLASIAGHALLMFTAPALRAHVAKIEAPPPLVAHLLREEAQPVAPPAARHAAISPEQQIENTLSAPRDPAPQPVVEAAPLPEPAPAVAAAPLPAPAPAPQVAAAAAPAAPPAREPAQAVQPAAATRAETVAAAPPALDPTSVNRYRIAVMGTANRYKRYPRIAQENNWQGRVEVTLRLRANGTIASLDIKKSAGYEALDRQAIDMIREANSRTPLPEVLRGREFAIDIPVVFSLRDPST